MGRPMWLVFPQEKPGIRAWCSRAPRGEVPACEGCVPSSGVSGSRDPTHPGTNVRKGRERSAKLACALSTHWAPSIRRMLRL